MQLHACMQRTSASPFPCIRSFVPQVSPFMASAHIGFYGYVKSRERK